MKRVAYFAAAAVLLAGAQAPALAQGKAGDEAPLTKDQRDHAVQAFGILSSALHSEKVDDEVKSALMACIYSNSIGTISGAIDKVIAANPGKVDRSDADAMLGVMAAVCGYKPKEAAATSGAAPKTAGKAAPKPAAKPAPKPEPGAPTGR